MITAQENSLLHELKDCFIVTKKSGGRDLLRAFPRNPKFLVILNLVELLHVDCEIITIRGLLNNKYDLLP